MRDSDDEHDETVILDPIAMPGEHDPLATEGDPVRRS
jgi:hypothetical protein